ncbi:MAG TPA: YtxH domain-containing protein [Anaerolineae bacterium]|nr:YtxH domain-containing protein [Anaerolineae bacterium]
MDNNKTGAVDFVAGFIVGALVGAAVAILFAPQSGEQTRELIREKGIEIKGRAEDLPAQAKTKAAEYQTRVKQAVDEGKTVAVKKKEELLAKVEGQPAAEAQPEA